MPRDIFIKVTNFFYIPCIIQWSLYFTTLYFKTTLDYRTT